MTKRPKTPKQLYDGVVSAAVSDFSINGYDSQERLDEWVRKIRDAALSMLKTPDEVDRAVRDALTKIYLREVENGGTLARNPGVSTYQLSMIKPELHAELQRRISAGVDLIKLNRPQAVEKTLQRFAGWATSVPAGGSPVVKRRDEKTKIKKALASLPYEERRVVIDQGNKLFSAINTTAAVGGGAIGAFWQSHKHQDGYNGRPAHNARDGRFFLVPDSWAIRAGYVRKGAYEYTTQIEQPGEFVFCRCAYQYIFSLRSLPKNCLTRKGEKALADARQKLKGKS